MKFSLESVTDRVQERVQDVAEMLTSSRHGEIVRAEETLTNVANNVIHVDFEPIAAPHVMGQLVTEIETEAPVPAANENQVYTLEDYRRRVAEAVEQPYSSDENTAQSGQVIAFPTRVEPEMTAEQAARAAEAREMLGAA